MKQPRTARATICQGVSSGEAISSWSDIWFAHDGCPYFGDNLLFNNVGNAAGLVSPVLPIIDYTDLALGQKIMGGSGTAYYTPPPEAVSYSVDNDYHNYGSLLTSLKGVAPAYSQPRERYVPVTEKGVMHVSLRGDVHDALIVSRTEDSDAIFPVKGIDFAPPIRLFKPGTSGCNSFVTANDPAGNFQDSITIVENTTQIPDWGLQLYNWDHFDMANKVAFWAPETVTFDNVPGFHFHYVWDYISVGKWTRPDPSLGLAPFTLTRSFNASYRFKISLDLSGGLYQWYFDVIRDLTFILSPDLMGTQLDTPRIADVFTVHDNSVVSPAGISNQLNTDYPNLDAFYDLSRFNRPVKVSKVGLPALESFIAQPTSTFSKNFLAFLDYNVAAAVTPWGTPVWKHEVKPRWKYLLDGFREYLPDIRASGFLAAKDALSSNVHALSFNALQDLQHVKDLADAVPDLKGLGEIASKAVKGDLSVVPALVDYFTEAVLKHNFVQRPIIRDGKELLATDLLRSIEAITKYRNFTWYGKFRYPLLPSENWMGDGEMILETRVKLRGNCDLSTLMATIFALEGCGALPTLSRVWSLVPFSFVVDWFTNESERLRSVDAQLQFLAINTYWCLYSYKISYIPSDVELARYNLFSDASDLLTYSVYLREVSRLMPRLTDSRLDLQRRTSGPDPVTVGSLLWQVLL
jgi:hypothetical protein